jgi:peptidoglycan/xylan/chitin deacetylase (PgdA/CDA1 family)
MPGRTPIINLTFHGIGAPPHAVDPAEASVWIDEDRFHRTLDAVRGRSDVHLTFDDGNRSDVEVALPALLERGLTGTFFVLAGRLDDAGYLSREDVRRLVEAGMTIGSHGMHHRDWRLLSAAALDDELGVARRQLQNVTDRPVDVASIPFGAYDRRVLARLRHERGFARIYTSDGGVARAGAWLQPRTSLTRNDPPGEPRLDARRTAPESAVLALKGMVKRWR